MDKEQLDRFGEVVEEKKQAAKEKSEAPHDDNPRETPIDGDERELTEPGRSADVGDPREKSSAKDKMTADKWNQ
jgi:hypothetical protein